MKQALQSVGVQPFQSVISFSTRFLPKKNKKCSQLDKTFECIHEYVTFTNLQIRRQVLYVVSVLWNKFCKFVEVYEGALRITKCVRNYKADWDTILEATLSLSEVQVMSTGATWSFSRCLNALRDCVFTGIVKAKRRHGWILCLLVSVLPFLSITKRCTSYINPLTRAIV